MEQQLQHCRKHSREICLVLMDLDHFKGLNDTHGHAEGDRVLQRAVMVCQAHLRTRDLFGRLGGEEFGIALPAGSLETAIDRVEWMRQAIASVGEGSGVPQVSISASFGVTRSSRCGYDLRQLMSGADDALYEAKREGRNRSRTRPAANAG